MSRRSAAEPCGPTPPPNDAPAVQAILSRRRRRDEPSERRRALRPDATAQRRPRGASYSLKAPEAR
jgi:hypothetical protein